MNKALAWSTQVLENPAVYLIRVPFPWETGRDTNCYLIDCEGAWLLVDTGSADERALGVMNAALDELGVDRARLQIFLTHLHRDHAGLVGALAEGGQTVYASATALECAAAEYEPGYPLHVRTRLESAGVNDAFIDQLVSNVGFSHALPEWLAPVATSPGDVVHVGAQDFTVIDTAGHTPGHIALWHETSKSLFSGDHLLFDVSPVLESRLAPANELEIYFANLQYVADMTPAQLFHAHGDLGGDVAARVAWLIGHHRARGARAVEAAQAEPGLTGAELISRLGWNIHGRPWSNLPITLYACILETGFTTLNQLTYDGRLTTRTQNATLRYFVE